MTTDAKKQALMAWKLQHLAKRVFEVPSPDDVFLDGYESGHKDGERSGYLRGRKEAAALMMEGYLGDDAFARVRILHDKIDDMEDELDKEASQANGDED